jgi:hypothetical protein
MPPNGRRALAGLALKLARGALVGAATFAMVSCSGSSAAPDGAGGKSTTVGSGGNGSGGSGSGGALATGTGGATAAGSGGSASGGAPVTGSGGTSEGTGGAAVGAGGRTGTGGIAGGGGGVGGVGGVGLAGAAGGPPIIDLFNGTDLTGWTANRESARADQSVTPGVVLTPNEALLIFKIENGTIRTYGDALPTVRQYRHTLVSTKSYSHYNFWVDYKWGTKKYPPYADPVAFPRDAGILFNLHNDLTQVWPSSIEFQIKDGSVGDIFALLARCTSLALNNGTTFVDTTGGGTMKVINGSGGNAQHMRSTAFPNLEIPNDWNTVQLQANAGAAVYIVNGHIVNKVLATMDTTGRAITSGPIALQAEHAEVFYRNIRIQVLP